MMNPGYSSGYEPDYSRLDLPATVPQRPPSQLRSSQTRATLAGSRRSGQRVWNSCCSKLLLCSTPSSSRIGAFSDHIVDLDLDGARRILASHLCAAWTPGSLSTLNPPWRNIRSVGPLAFHTRTSSRLHGYLRPGPGIHSGSSTTATLPCNRPCIKAPESPLPMSPPTRGPARPGSLASC